MALFKANKWAEDSFVRFGMVDAEIVDGDDDPSKSTDEIVLSFFLDGSSFSFASSSI